MYEQFGSDVIRLYWEGNSVKNVASALDISEWSVRKILRLAGGKIPHPNTYDPHMGYTRIPQERVKQIKTLAEQGFNITQIAEALNVNRKTVKRYAPGAAHDKRSPMLPEKVLAEMASLVESGEHTAEQIAKMVGVSAQTVRHHHPEIKGRKKPNALSDEVLEQIRLLVEDKAPIAEIERTTGVYSATIKKYFPEAGLSYAEAAEYRWMMRRFREIEEQWKV